MDAATQVTLCMDSTLFIPRFLFVELLRIDVRLFEHALKGNKLVGHGSLKRVSITMCAGLGSTKDR